VSPRAELAELVLGGDPAPWADVLGITDGADVGAVRLRFAPAEPPGLRAAALRDLRADQPDGLPLREQQGVRPLVARATRGLTPGCAGNGPLAVDHVVALTDDLRRTTAALVAAGLDLRRTAGAAAFFVLGPALLELVERGDAVERPRLWGVTFVVPDVDAPRPHVGPARDAVQPGRRIGTVREDAGLGVPVALITPRH